MGDDVVFKSDESVREVRITRFDEKTVTEQLFPMDTEQRDREVGGGGGG